MITKLFDEVRIEQTVRELASEVEKSFAGELTVVGILKGSFVFVADLVRALDRVGLAPRVEFIRLSSYGASRKPSKLRLVGPAPHVSGDVLLVDDITDTGWSLRYAADLLRPRARLLRTCTLIDKPGRRQVDITPDFVGFTVEGDVFVVGYGIDCAESYRHLPWIGAID